MLCQCKNKIGVSRRTASFSSNIYDMHIFLETFFSLVTPQTNNYFSTILGNICHKLLSDDFIWSGKGDS